MPRYSPRTIHGVRPVSFGYQCRLRSRRTARRRRRSAPGTVNGRPHTTRAELKALRTNPTERARFIRELTSTWNEIASFATVAPAELAAGAPRDTYLPLLTTSTLDGYDPALVAEARRHRITTIVTHDSDFGSVSQLIVLTANDALLR